MRHRFDSTIREWFRSRSFGLYARGATEATRSLEVGQSYAIRPFRSRQPVAIPTVAMWSEEVLRDIVTITCLERGTIELTFADRTKAIILMPTTSQLGKDLVLRDDLTCIYKVTADLENVMNRAGIVRFAQIARWTAKDVQYYGARFGTGLINSHKWIEQCGILERGDDTPHSRQRRRDKARDRT